MSDPSSFGAVCTTWGQTCNIWSQCIVAVVEEVYGGARNPQEWGDHPFDNYEDQQKALLDFQKKNPPLKSILIDIYIKCANKKYKKKLELPAKKAVVNVDDVQFILTTLKEVGVDIKNIRNYNDNDLNNLLS